MYTKLFRQSVNLFHTANGEGPEESVIVFMLFTSIICKVTLSEKIANCAVYHLPSPLSVNIELGGLFKFREESGVESP